MTKFLVFLAVYCMLFESCTKREFSGHTSVNSIDSADFSLVPGTVVAHLPASGNVYIGSPSICKLPNGDYLASHDFFGDSEDFDANSLQRTIIYKSSDNGSTWAKIAQEPRQFYSTLFYYGGAAYLLGPGRGADLGYLVLRKSTDGGNTWSNPDSITGYGRVLLSKDLNPPIRISTAPTPVVFHNGRIWKAFEDWNHPVAAHRNEWPKKFGPFMMSAPIGVDLLDGANWTPSNSVWYDNTTWNDINGAFGDVRQYKGFLEGNAVVAPSGIKIIARVYIRNGDSLYKANEVAAKINVSGDGLTTNFNPDADFFKLPGGAKKFTIRYDSTANRYITVSNYIPQADRLGTEYPSEIRNTLALCSSTNLLTWKVHHIVLNHPDKLFHGFQYADWQFDGNDIIFVSRTSYEDGMGGAHSFHDSNLLTFHRISNYADYFSSEIE